MKKSVNKKGQSTDYEAGKFFYDLCMTSSIEFVSVEGEQKLDMEIERISGLIAYVLKKRMDIVL